MPPSSADTRSGGPPATRITLLEPGGAPTFSLALLTGPSAVNLGQPWCAPQCGHLSTGPVPTSACEQSLKGPGCSNDQHTDTTRTESHPCGDAPAMWPAHAQTGVCLACTQATGTRRSRWFAPPATAQPCFCQTCTLACARGRLLLLASPHAGTPPHLVSTGPQTVLQRTGTRAPLSG